MSNYSAVKFKTKKSTAHKESQQTTIHSSKRQHWFCHVSVLHWLMDIFIYLFFDWHCSPTAISTSTMGKTSKKRERKHKKTNKKDKKEEKRFSEKQFQCWFCHQCYSDCRTMANHLFKQHPRTHSCRNRRDGLSYCNFSSHSQQKLIEHMAKSCPCKIWRRERRGNLLSKYWRKIESCENEMKMWIKIRFENWNIVEQHFLLLSHHEWVKWKEVFQ